MKKSFFFAAALVAMVACNKSESSVSISNPEEIGFFTMSQNATRGYITGTVFSDIANPDCRDKYNSTVPADSTYRTMIVSAYNKTDGQDYFKAMEFTADKEVKSDPTHAAIWHSKPVQYWPIGKELEFLTFSQQNINGRDNAVANWDGAKKVSFAITPKQCYQNDIVYAQASGSNRGTAPDSSSQSDKGLSVTYFHSQAWLTFNVTVVGKDSTAVSDSARIKVDKIVLEDVYNSGVLTFEYDATTAETTKQPKASWDFFTQNPTDVEVDDPYNCMARGKNGLVYAQKSSGKDLNGFQLNMLMPAQKHNDFVLYYTMNKQQDSVVLPFTKGNVTGTFSTEDNKDWKMGYHYIYNITIEINELTFAPTVTAWTEVKGFSPETQAI